MADNFDFAALAKSWQQQVTPAEEAPTSADLAQASQRQREHRSRTVPERRFALTLARHQKVTCTPRLNRRPASET